MSMIKNIFAVSVITILAIGAPAFADIASKGYVDDAVTGLENATSNKVTDVSNYTGDLSSTVKYPSMAVAQQIAGTAAATASAGVANKIDKTVAAQSNGVMVRNSSGTAMKALGTDVSVANDGTLTVSHATSADSATSATTAQTANSVAWGNVDNKPETFAPSAHNQASNTINAMTGYEKASAAAAIETTDSLNTAIGKLEKALDGKQASGSYETSGTAAGLINALDGATGSGNVSGGNVVTEVTQSNGLVTVTHGKAVNAVATATGAGNVVTAVTLNSDGKTINVVKGATALTEHQDISGKADKATGLTGATKTKITYNSDGIVTAGADLAVADIPNNTVVSGTNTTVTRNAANAANNPNAYTVSVADASTSAKGVIEIATDQEALTGTSETLAVNPKQLAQARNKIPSGSENSTTLASIWVE